MVLFGGYIFVLSNQIKMELSDTHTEKANYAHQYVTGICCKERKRLSFLILIMVENNSLQKTS